MLLLLRGSMLKYRKGKGQGACSVITRGRTMVSSVFVNLRILALAAAGAGGKKEATAMAMELLHDKSFN